MKAFTEPLKQLGEFDEMQKYLKTGRGMVQISGCIDSQKLHMIHCLSDGFRWKIIVTFSELKAKEIYEDYKFYDRNVLLYPAKDMIFYQSDIHSNLIIKERLEVIKAVMEREPMTIVTTLDGFMDRLTEQEQIRNNVLYLKAGEVINLDDFKKQLIASGFEKNYQVETPGQFAVRGGIIDIFPLTEENPYRIELWDDEIDSIRSFDVLSQRSIENMEELKIYPATELVFSQESIQKGLNLIKQEAEKIIESLRQEMKTQEAYRIQTSVEELVEQINEFGLGANLDSYVPYFSKKTVCFLEYFKEEETILFLDEPNRIMERGRAVEEEFQESMKNRLEKGYILPGQMNILYPLKEVLVKLNDKRGVALSTLDVHMTELSIRTRFNINVKSVNPYNNSFELLVKDLKQFKKEGYGVVLLSGSRTRAKRLADDLSEYELNIFYTDDLDRKVKPGEIMVSYGKVKKGFEYPILKFAVISESDIFGSEKKKKKKRKKYEGQRIQSFTDLYIGDYVVHENHGLGIYRGIEKVEVDKIVKDYMKIEYAGNGNLYIPATQLNMIQKYAGSDAKKPKLNKLGTQEWAKTKTKVKGAVKEIARELVELYATRQEKQGFVYGKDTVWQTEFEDMFPYEETEDQMLAIEATKRDMESKKIMDRLICGDVGYGKTEIAIRAAFKAVQEGKQVVYLVPTTILAQQHYNTFVQRMKDFPVRVDLLCRFRTPGEQKKTISDLRSGLVDILIGTHRVLSKDVAFKDLGLLIIDEEQRFGVAHKEKIKQLKNNIDVLTLTATPIPRTLHMSLIGIRDMSVLEEAPNDRVPIQTYVMEYNDEMVREAVNRELARGGQVYYVYNRVNTIQDITQTIANLVPEANVAYAHGQMKEHQLEKIMYDFINGDIDVLVSTTIIETGLDISNVNTMIIHDADNLGLSQLYQLRGRVGRSNRTAYAFLMYKRDKMLKEVAEKRLHAIKEFTELGSGFKIAMRDLEIRGAGSLLGAQQHGHMEAVGYDLYCKMLNEAVKHLKGIEDEDSFDTTIDLDIDAYIPENYIQNEFHKLDIYKRIASIENDEEYDEMVEELLDRFGDMPKSVQNLLEVSKLRALAHSLQFIEISKKGDIYVFTLFEKAKIKVELIPDFLEIYNDKMKFTLGANPFFSYYPPKNNKNMKENSLELIRGILDEMQMLRM
ncbi:transcription-repair coupling factor [Anaerosacchariphilus polymeriproducens]|uniref:Transcription-repair-coupling factor n=1 Tax=Anaerosacchariphilus polymeriproducens TaxID=1812858 RepID=A0A371B040_9FIRM|nr:transcription-repair coupling factor [Anaerosacchariphilus polymeriproducens]RDU25112.1 transcription-repair coupling factor [Anaerosacchariphilus polymeriproducens]